MFFGILFFRLLRIGVGQEIPHRLLFILLKLILVVLEVDLELLSLDKHVFGGLKLWDHRGTDPAEVSRVSLELQRWLFILLLKTLLLEKISLLLLNIAEDDFDSFDGVIESGLHFADARLLQDLDDFIGPARAAHQNDLVGQSFSEFWRLY